MTRLHFVDGTYELFRAFYGAPPRTSPAGLEVGATVGFVRTIAGLLRQPDVTHVACAFDTVIESFRNDLFEGYKTGAGIEPALWAQFPLVERAAHSLGVVVWSMIEFETDDALATAAARWAEADGVEQVVLCSPDKDFAQCVRGDRVVCLDRRRQKLMNEPGVWEKFGVGPASIPDWLALVGDTADGIPGVPRWGAKSAAAVLARYERLEEIPDDPDTWDVQVRGRAALGASLRAAREAVSLYRTLATLRTDVPLPEDLDGLRWRGVREAELAALGAELGFNDLVAERPWLPSSKSGGG
ncbi:MAG: 5'-3' exonuclease H3TH domain-containing protein [Planctomycetota bacterium]